jgi:ubiquinol-cytochrome c reductase cytochrome c subunit
MYRPAPCLAQMVGLALSLQLCCSGSSANEGSAQEISRGAAAYRAVGCYACHGRVGQGAIYTGPPLTPLRLSAEALASYVRAPTGLMPAYSAAILSDDDLRAIVAYLHSLPPGHPPDHIPLLAPYALHPGGK